MLWLGTAVARWVKWRIRSSSAGERRVIQRDATSRWCSREQKHVYKGETSVRIWTLVVARQRSINSRKVRPKVSTDNLIIFSATSVLTASPIHRVGQLGMTIPKLTYTR
ncbi:hypothetical protein HPP92_005188 [Vanilla planifolia]|uniref:Uncharacterized protein n=1 Tax=Vanilla planifolia TaxID=51239 RepID=A0A835RM94_VANPL|nr:hypothetical protein HPP92_005188 [Vanilla planifolia]